MPKAAIGYQPVPPAYHTRIAYYDRQIMTESVAAGGAFYSYKLTDLYDPNFTGVGSQPISYDQWSTLYQRFKVMQNIISVTFGNKSTEPMEVGFFMTTTSTLPANPLSWPVQNRGGAKMIAPTAGGPCVHEFRAVVKPWEVFGVTRQQYVDDMDFSHATNSSPTRNIYLHIFVAGYASTALTGQARVTMTYDVELSELLPLTIS